MNKTIKTVIGMMMAFVLVADSSAYIYAFEEESVTSTYDEVPTYYQTDYPDTPYSAGTVATSGCGITCLAMLATYLTDTEYLPDELANTYNQTGSSNVARMENGIADLGLPFIGKVYVWGTLMDDLKMGRTAIVLMNNESIFTDFGHFVVFKGITEDGKVLVNDPYKPNYDRFTKCFESGFEQWRVIKGFSGAWVFEKKTESEDTPSGKLFVAMANNGTQRPLVSMPYGLQIQPLFKKAPKSRLQLS